MHTKIKIFFVIILFSICAKSFSQDANTTPKPYEDSEFTEFQLDLRRFEIITFGSLPFITLDVVIIYSAYTWIKSGFGQSFPNPFTQMSNYTKNEIIGVIITSFSISILIAVTDLIINKIKRNESNKQTIQDIYILPEEQNPISNNNEISSNFNDNVQLSIDIMGV